MRSSSFFLTVNLLHQTQNPIDREHSGGGSFVEIHGDFKYCVTTGASLLLCAASVLVVPNITRLEK